MEMGGQRHAPAALPPGKIPGTHWIGDWVGPRAILDRHGKSRPAPGFDPRTVQPVASRYTDWVIAVRVQGGGCTNNDRRKPKYLRTKQAIKVHRNIEARSCNCCCSGKAVGITYSECVFVALRIQHIMRMRHIVICGLPGCTIFFHIISQTARVLKISYWTQNVCFDILYNFCLQHFSL